MTTRYLFLTLLALAYSRGGIVVPTKRLRGRGCVRSVVTVVDPVPHRTPCIEGAHDRARRFHPRRTPCTQSAHDRARRFVTHRTPCNKSAHDRARRLMHHRTPCTCCADDRADKRCTPCTPSASSPRARMAPLSEGLSSASHPFPRKASFRLPHLSHRRQRQARP